MWRNFMVPKHHKKAFILLLSNSGQSQLHFGTKFILAGACVAKIGLNFVYMFLGWVSTKVT